MWWQGAEPEAWTKEPWSDFAFVDGEIVFMVRLGK